MEKSSIIFNKRLARLEPVITKFKSSGKVAKKFANILSGESEKETLGLVKKNVAKLFGVKPRSVIRITRQYALHMDNSGHFTGEGFGRHAHNDNFPLSAEDIEIFPQIINSVEIGDIMPVGKIRGLERFLIAKSTRQNTIIVIEIISRKDAIDIVTAYNVSRVKYLKIRRQILAKQKSL